MLPTVSLLHRPPEPPSDPDLELLGPPDRALAAPREPVFRGPLESMLLPPILVVVPVLLCVGVAVIAGLVRQPTYSAEARINVGRTDVPAYTLQGTTIGNATLASSYSRAVPAQP